MYIHSRTITRKFCCQNYKYVVLMLSSFKMNNA